MFKNKKASSASVVDGNLIISLPGAKQPVVWRMALGEARAAALEVIEKKGEAILVLKYPKGDSIDIAPFDNKTQALDALMSVSRAMHTAHGKIRSGSDAAPVRDTPRKSSTSFNWKWLIPFALIILSVFLYSHSVSMVPSTYIDENNISSPNNTDITGVPMSADSFLSGM